MNTFIQHLKKPELAPLFVSVGFAMGLCGVAVTRAALTNPDVTWSRERNPEPWQAIKPGQKVKFFGKDVSSFPRPASDKAYEAIGR